MGTDCHTSPEVTGLRQAAPRGYSTLWLKRKLTPPLVILAALLMWIEDSLWQWLKRLTAWVALIPIVRRFEAHLRALPPYGAMIVFLLPTTLLFPLKLFAVYLVTRGYILASLGLLLSAKVIGTAIVARMYVVCQPKLLSIGWFHRVHDWLVWTRDALYAAIRAMPIYQQVHARLVSMKLAVQAVMITLRRHHGIWVRWRAIRRWYRQKAKQAAI
jgi:hypothetical protein